jgi:hypothetical protein
MHPKIHFVVNRLTPGELAELCAKRLGVDFPYWLGGPVNWPVQTYLQLRGWRDGISIGTAAQPGAINIAHVTAWHELGARIGEYRVSMRADYTRVFDVDFEILQNPEAVRTATQGYVCYWPVPGIIPRDPGRRGLACIAYAGRPGARNLDGFLNRPHFPLHGRTVDFLHIAKEQWHNMANVDAVVGIRSFSNQTYPDKPPSKLINAWHARVPLIGGYDSAFSKIGTPGEDYLRVQTTAEFEEALALLDDPEVYARIVENGAAKARAFTAEALAQNWLELFDTKVIPHFLNHGPLATVPRLLRRSLDHGRDLLSRAKRRLRVRR